MGCASSRDMVMSRDEFIYKYIASRDGTVFIYTSRRGCKYPWPDLKNDWTDRDPSRLDR